VAVVHCKAGKGRTGLMICCWLLFAKDWDTADKAMAFYALARTQNQKGVTIPSQIRYIRYFEEKMRFGQIEAEPLTLTHIILYGVPKNVQELKLGITKGPTQIPVFAQKKKVKDLLKDKKKKGKKKKSAEETPSDISEAMNGEGSSKLVLEVDVELCGDIRFDFEKLLHFWINTAFVQDRTVLYKPELDKVNKDSKHKLYPPDFRVELRFRCDTNFLEERQKRHGVHSPLTSPAVARQAPSAPSRRKGSSQHACRNLLQAYPSLLNI